MVHQSLQQYLTIKFHNFNLRFISYDKDTRRFLVVLAYLDEDCSLAWSGPLSRKGILMFVIHPSRLQVSFSFHTEVII